MSAVQHCYQVFGLVLTSDNPIPGLINADKTSAPDITVHFKNTRSVPAGFHPVTPRPPNRNEWDERLGIFISPDHSLYRLQYQGGHDFLIEASGHTIWINHAAETDFPETLFYLLGPVLGTAIRLLGYVCLHASAVEIDGHAIALTGPSGGGKSTTAAALVQKGYPLITEDLLVIKPVSGIYYACPGYPRLRLWSDSAGFIYSDNVRLEKLAADWDKHSLDLPEHQLPYVLDPVPLTLIYTRSNDAPSTMPVINTVKAKDALITLLANTYPRHIHAFGKTQRAHELDMLEKLVHVIPLKEIAYHPGLEHLDALCTAIIDDATASIRSSTNIPDSHAPALI